MSERRGSVSSGAAADGNGAHERSVKPRRGRQRTKDAGPTPVPSVVWTKLVPPNPPAGFVRRPRLEDLLDRGVQGPLTLLSAHPGTGKTVLLASWAADPARTLDVAWMSIDRDDNWAPRFWAGVARALGGRGGGRLGRDPVGRVVDLVTRRSSPVALVLDDFQELESPSLRAAVQTLVDRAPPRLRIVLSTRTDPRLRLHRLRLAGTIAEIRAADLACTSEECRALLGTTAELLSSEEVELLRVRTEGWAAGIRLAALSLARTRDPARFVRRFAGDDRAVADYLLTEILGRQPPARQRFLLRTSVPDILTADLAAELTGRSGTAAAELAGLEADNLLLGSEGDGETVYRYTSLLREFLRTELRRRLPADLRRLHLRSARWHWSRGDAVPAFRSASASGDTTLAAEICSEAWHVVLLADVDAAPSPAAAPLALHAAWRALATGDLGVAERLLGTASGAHDVDELWTVVELAVARHLGDTGRIHAAAHSLLGADSRGTADQVRTMRALALAALGALAAGDGDLDLGEEQLEEALALARDERLAPIAADVLAQLALIGVARGRLRHSARLADEAVALADGHRGCAAAAGAANLALAWIGYQWDDLATATAHVERAEAAAAACGDRETALAAAAVHALALATQGPRGAEEGLRRLRASRGALDDPRVSARVEALAAATEARVRAARGDRESSTRAGRGRADALLRARLLLAARRPDEALRELDEVGTEPVFDLRAAATESCVLEAVAHWELHDRTAAAAALERALEIAGPNTHRRPFVDGGPPVRELLVRQIRSGTAHRSLVAELIAAFDRRAPKVALTRVELLEPLSPREEAVLRYLPTMMSNTEIAGELFVSGNTVKTHLKSIYRKLGVARRRDAVERARALELL